MNLAAVDLNLLVSLDLLLEEGSVRGAARRAGVSPSAMSHTLARLRELLDDELLVRAGRGMVPTPRAEALVVPVKELLAQTRTLLSSAQDFRPESLRRRFRVACTDHVTTVLLGPAEGLLQAEAPGLDLIVSPVHPETMEDLRRGVIDVVIGIFPDAPPEIRMRRLFSDRFITVCRADHPRLAGRTSISLDDYLAESHVLVAPRGTPEGLVDRILDESGRSRRVSCAFPSFLSAVWHTSRTDALLTVSLRLVEAVSGTLPLLRFEPPVPLEDYTLMLAWHPRVDKAVEDRWFRSVIVRMAEMMNTSS